MRRGRMRPRVRRLRVWSLQIRILPKTRRARRHTALVQPKRPQRYLQIYPGRCPRGTVRRRHSQTRTLSGEQPLPRSHLPKFPLPISPPLKSPLLNTRPRHHEPLRTPNVKPVVSRKRVVNGKRVMSQRLRTRTAPRETPARHKRRPPFRGRAYSRSRRWGRNHRAMHVPTAIRLLLALTARSAGSAQPSGSSRSTK